MHLNYRDKRIKVQRYKETARKPDLGTLSRTPHPMMLLYFKSLYFLMYFRWACIPNKFSLLFASFRENLVKEYRNKECGCPIALNIRTREFLDRSYIHFINKYFMIFTYSMFKFLMLFIYINKISFINENMFYNFISPFFLPYILVSSYFWVGHSLSQHLLWGNIFL